MTRWPTLFILACAVVGLNSCASYEAGRSNALIRVSYDAADMLAEQLTVGLGKETPIVVATFVDINRLSESSTLGRLMAEQVSARLTQLGFPIVELKLRGSVFVREGKGELMLSREVRDLSLEYKVQAVVVGTYAPGLNRFFLNLKIVRPTDNRILAAQDLAVDVDDGLQAMLMRGGGY